MTPVAARDDVPLGPSGLGIVQHGPVRPGPDGSVEMTVVAGVGLDGPPGVLQGGLASTIALAAARRVDGFGAPLTALDARLHAPTPLGRPLTVRVAGGSAPATYDVTLHHGARLLVASSVELAGVDAPTHVADLVALADEALAPPRDNDLFPTCFGCGGAATHPLALHLAPRGHSATHMSVPWVADERVGDAEGAIDDAVVAAALDCMSAWAAMPAAREAGHAAVVLGRFHLRVLRPAPVLDPLRVVARGDGRDGRKLRARAGLIDDEGGLLAFASALHIAVSTLPRAD